MTSRVILFLIAAIILGLDQAACQQMKTLNQFQIRVHSKDLMHLSLWFQNSKLPKIQMKQSRRKTILFYVTQLSEALLSVATELVNLQTREGCTRANTMSTIQWSDQLIFLLKTQNSKTKTNLFYQLFKLRGNTISQIWMQRQSTIK